LFPRIIAGSSAGALVAACICTHKYSDLWKIFDTDYEVVTAHFLDPAFDGVLDAINKLRKGELLLN